MRRGRRGLAIIAASGAAMLASGSLVTGWSGGPFTSSAAAASGRGFSATKEVSRVNLVDGIDQVVDRRTVSVSIDSTTRLRDGQQVQVQWSGARPTGGVRLDPNSQDAVYQEFPVVILQCRGVDSAGAPAAQRVSPETCWTQYPRERFQSSGVGFPEFRVDRYASPSERQAIVGAPDPRPSGCYSSAAERWVPFVAASGTAYHGGPNGCAGMAPEASVAGGGALVLPPNDTYAATRTDGTGSARFRIETASENASLGCSQQVACSLEVIPIEGVSCDTAAASLPATDQPLPGAEADATTAECLRDGGYAPGALAAAGAGASDPGVSGALWWSASNWRNRIAVPLTFAVPDNVCDAAAVSKGSSNIFGSELLVQATTAWSPAFCLDATRYPFTHVQVGEPQAANGIVASTGVEAAFVSDPPAGGWTKPVVMAPTAVTGFAIAYAIDDGDKHQYSQLRLTPRLLAKLLSESYPAVSAVKSAYPALKDNPIDITADPEFRALNPGLDSRVDPGPAAASLLTMSGGTDVTTALTAYINADPDARAWLDGAPDPWGMVVNPNYKGIALPVDTWPLLDTFEPTDLYRPGINDCLHDTPVPFLPLVSAPLSRLSYVTLAMQYSLANAQIVCHQPIPLSTDGEKLVGLGRQTIGYRFLLGVVPLANADRYGLDTAALLTHVDPSAPTTFTDGTGRSFVTPSEASLGAAVSFLAPDETTRTWPLPYSTWRTAAAAGAYPGTLIVYTALPTSGLAKADAGHYADFLSFVAGAGQVAGSGSGQLPPGYLPITAANGLGALARYTSGGGGALRPPVGGGPRLTGVIPTTAPVPSPTPTAGTGSGPAVPSARAPGSLGTPATASAPTPAPSPAATRSASAMPSAIAVMPVGLTTALGASPGAAVLPALLVLAGAAGLLAALVLGQASLRSRR
jgi:hypothetical protein